ncbi:MAG: tyrosine-type recombinase/integrase [Lachnospiraceae bacterium]|nr:tyrosine-type recombinase/integrase [Lachnospiraceae bacterium]
MDTKYDVLSTDDLLKPFLLSGTITVGDVCNSTEEKTMQTIISKIHKYPIEKPKEDSKDQRWFTYVPDETKSNGRKRVAAKTQALLYKKLLVHYGVPESAQKSLMTFHELFEEWVAYKEKFVCSDNRKKGLSSTTIRKYRTDYQRCLSNSAFDTTPLKDITSVFIETELVNIIKQKKLKRRFMENFLGYIKSVFEYAVRSKIISVNEFVYVDKQLVLSATMEATVKRDEERTLNASERDALIRAIRLHELLKPKYMPDYAIELALLTGMRVGEIVALRWSDIRNGYLYIDHAEQRTYVDGVLTYVIGEPKNAKHRKLPISDGMKSLLKRIKEQGIDSDFVFANADGSRISTNMVQCACRHRSKEAGISTANIHKIRRTVASELRKIYPREVVAYLLGHLEKTDDDFYDYDNSEYSEKLSAMNHLCSLVLIPDDQISA